MKVITKYVADDNTEFNNYDDCAKYEAIANELSSVLNGLFECKRTDFQSGYGYIQHPKGTRTRLENSLKGIASRYFNNDFSESSANGFMGRYINDTGLRCFNRLLTRIQCITAEDREYGQPYYAFNPEKATNVLLN